MARKIVGKEMIRIGNKKKIILIAALCVVCFAAGMIASGTAQRIWYNLSAPGMKVPAVTDAGRFGNSQNENQSLPQTGSTNIPPQPNSQNQNVSISLEQAKTIALQKACFTENQVYFKKARLDFDDGRWEYEIEFIKDYVEYDAEIDAQTGTIYKWEMDRD